MKRGAREEEDELADMIKEMSSLDVNISKEIESELSRLELSQYNEGPDIPMNEPISPDLTYSFSRPERRSRKTKERNEREPQIDRLNVDIMEQLRDISKSPLHFEDSIEGEEHTNKIQDSSRFQPMQDIIRKHSTLQSPRPIKPPFNTPVKRVHPYPVNPGQVECFDSVDPTDQGEYVPREEAQTVSQQDDREQTVSIPRDQLLEFFQTHLPDKDSYCVIEALAGNVMEIPDKEDLKKFSREGAYSLPR